MIQIPSGTPEQVHAVQRRQQVQRQRQDAEHGAEGDQRQQRQLELGVAQPPQVDVAVGGRVGQLLAG